MADPQVSRRIYEVFRKADHKLLGKAVFYGRGGGTFQALGMAQVSDVWMLEEENERFLIIFFKNLRRVKNEY